MTKIPLLAGLAALCLHAPAWAASPVTINNAANTHTMAVNSDGSINVDISGGSGTVVTGNVSNATSGVATTSTNVPTVSYNYGFNGTTWDQLQVDGLKYLRVDAAEAAFSLTGSATSATTLTNFPAVLSTSGPGTQSFTAQWTSAGAGNTAGYQGSNDGVTWFNIPCWAATNLSQYVAPANSFSVATATPITCNTLGFAQIKIFLSGFSSGTATAQVQFNQTQTPVSLQGLISSGGVVANYGAANGGGTFAANTGVNNLRVINAGLNWNGTTYDPQFSGPGEAAGGAGTGSASVEEDGRSYFHVAASGTSAAIKSGKGNLHTMTVNTCVGSATITLDDALTATTPTMAIFTCPSVITSFVPVTLTYDIAFGTGLTMVMSGNTDVTLSYR